MRYPYKTILCPIDFDENSLAALAHARRLAADMGATIHLLHALPILPMLTDRGSLPLAADEASAEAEATRRLKDVARRRLGRTPYAIHTRVAFVSDVPRSILAVARDLDADLIVMATHGRSGLRHVFVGSVAEAVMRNAACPVLTIRPIAGPLTARPAAASRRPAAASRRRAPSS
ncbi:MAG TPA: universal stress protein [Candidatus Binataceae bacterium]|jgi:nucleotide-binding universal stress UspA family protein|nr:universal stress protein [Candidatus Binataceae bacterium]